MLTELQNGLLELLNTKVQINFQRLPVCSSLSFQAADLSEFL